MRLALIPILFFTAVRLPAAQPPLLWATPARNAAIAIALNRLGEIHIAGFLSGTVQFGSSNVTAIQSNTPFIAKYSPNGDPIWWRAATTTNGASLTDIGCAPSNDVVIVAFCRNATAFDSIPIQTNGSLCVVRYRADGTPRWLRQVVCEPIGFGSQRGTPMILGADGSVYLTTTFRGLLSLAETNVAATGQSTPAFLLKFNPDGTLAWLKHLATGSGFNTVRPHGVGEDSHGNVYLTGHFDPNLNVGVTNLISRGGYDVFVLSYDSAGNFRWIFQGGGTGPLDESWSLAVGPGDKIIVAGSFESPMEFGSQSFTNVTPQDFFLAQFNANGGLLWFNQIEANGSFGREQVTMDTSGNSYMAGAFDSPATFGKVAVTNGGATNWFLAKYGRDGEFKWVQQFGAGFLNAIVTDAAGNVVIAGAGPGVFGGTNLIGEGFIAKYGTTDATLSIARLQTDALLSWSSLAVGFSLEAKDSLSPVSWSPVTNVVTTAGSAEVGFRNLAVLPLEEQKRFFRLRRD